jgi:polyisoprenoid-binding protein YceI
MATGTLNLHGVEAPLNIPFTLSITDGVASAKGAATIDRRTHDIGAVQATENNLGFNVGASFDLTAAKSE